MTIRSRLQESVALQRNYFLLAVAFFTRIPIPADTPFSAERLNHASRYFSLVGWIVGLCAALSLLLAYQLFPISIAVLISMSASIKITGAFHEDGLADMSDGLGGGMSQERKLEIMKDSRLGTYGALALLLAIMIKFVALYEIMQLGLMESLVALLVIHASSRAVAGSLIFDMPYVRESGKAKPLAQNQSSIDLCILLVFGALPLCLLSIQAAVGMLMIGIITRSWIKRWLLRQLGGYTGDCLGATQQITELLCYLLWLALSHQQIPRLSMLIQSL